MYCRGAQVTMGDARGDDEFVCGPGDADRDAAAGVLVVRESGDARVLFIARRRIRPMMRIR